MKITNQKILILALLPLFSILISCSKDDPSPQGRTLAQEMQELDELIRQKEADGFDVDTTDLGVFYIVFEEGTGPYPQAGDICVLEYFAYLPDGTEFDATRDYSENKWEFIFKYEANLPTGLNDAIEEMNEGTQMDVFVPSPLAFGKQGTNLVPPYTTVIYRAIMHEVKPQQTE